MNKSINVLDFETFNHNNETIPYFIGLLLNGDRFIYFEGLDCVHNFFIFLSESEITNTIFCHNLTFDGGFLLHYLYSKKMKKINIIIHDASFYKIEFLYKNKNIVLQCSYKFFPVPLKLIGDLIDSKKGEFDYSIININNYNNTEVIKMTKDYCEQDCLIVFKALNKIINSSGIFGIKQTAPAAVTHVK